MCCIWGFLQTRPLLVKKATSQTKQYRSFSLRHFLPSNNHGVLLWCSGVYITSLQSKDATHLSLRSWRNMVKWLKDLSVQKWWKALIQCERKDKTGRTSTCRTSQGSRLLSYQQGRDQHWHELWSRLLCLESLREVTNAKKTEKVQICKALDECAPLHVMIPAQIASTGQIKIALIKIPGSWWVCKVNRWVS